MYVVWCFWRDPWILFLCVSNLWLILMQKYDYISVFRAVHLSIFTCNTPCIFIFTQYLFDVFKLNDIELEKTIIVFILALNLTDYFFFR